jgi:hypothetical protein
MLRKTQRPLLTRYPDMANSHSVWLLLASFLFLAVCIVFSHLNNGGFAHLDRQLGFFKTQMLLAGTACAAWLLCPRHYDVAQRYGHRDLRMEYVDLLLCIAGTALFLGTPYLAWEEFAYRSSKLQSREETLKDIVQVQLAHSYEESLSDKLPFYHSSRNSEIETLFDAVVDASQSFKDLQTNRAWNIDRMRSDVTVLRATLRKYAGEGDLDFENAEGNSEIDECIGILEKLKPIAQEYPSFRLDKPAISAQTYAKVLLSFNMAVSSDVSPVDVETFTKKYLEQRAKVAAFCFYTPDRVLVELLLLAQAQSIFPHPATSHALRSLCVVSGTIVITFVFLISTRANRLLLFIGIALAAIGAVLLLDFSLSADWRLLATCSLVLAIAIRYRRQLRAIRWRRLSRYLILLPAIYFFVSYMDVNLVDEMHEFTAKGLSSEGPPLYFALAYVLVLPLLRRLYVNIQSLPK